MDCSGLPGPQANSQLHLTLQQRQPYAVSADSQVLTPISRKIQPWTYNRSAVSTSASVSPPASPYLHTGSTQEIQHPSAAHTELPS
jgi:hypothetical protein